MEQEIELLEKISAMIHGEFGGTGYQKDIDAFDAFIKQYSSPARLVALDETSCMTALGEFFAHTELKCHPSIEDVIKLKYFLLAKFGRREIDEKKLMKLLEGHVHFPSDLNDVAKAVCEAIRNNQL
jgi:hypothetical protein